MRGAQFVLIFKLVAEKAPIGSQGEVGGATVRAKKAFRRSPVRRSQMEVRFENGLAGNGWMFDRVNGLFREFDGRTRNMVPTVDVTEDKDAYHFYFEMPGLTNESIDARVENGRWSQRSASGPNGPTRPRSTWRSGAMERLPGVRAAQRREPRQDRGQLQGRRAR